MNGLSIRAARFRRPARIVAGLGLVAGLAFALVTPPLSGYDEPIHFLRAYQVSEGGLAASHHGKQLGGAIPIQLRTDLVGLLESSVFSSGSHTAFLKHLGDRPARGPKVFVDFASGAVYSPATYAPAALFMRIGRVFGVSTLALIYLGRIGGLLATVALLSLAVRRMPTRAWMLAAIATLPVTVFQAAMLSADGVTIALAVLVLAQALDLAATPRGEVTHRKLVEIALATVALGLAKPPYILFALAFAIPWRRHGGRVARSLSASVGAGFVAAAAWGAYASTIYVAPKLPSNIVGHITRYTVYTHVDPGRQERFVLEHPWHFLATIGRTFGSYWSEIVRGSVAQLPWAVSAWVAVAAFAIVGIAAIEPETRDEPLLGWRSRVLLAGIALASFLALMLLAYTGWNAVGSPRIGAFQGRYLLPLLPLVILSLPARQARAPATEQRSLGALLTIAPALLLTAVWFSLRSHFY